MAREIAAAGEDLRRADSLRPSMMKDAGSRGGLPPWETKFVLYRPSHKKDKTDKIVLVKDNKKKAK